MPRLNYSDNMFTVQLLSPAQIAGDGTEKTGTAVDLRNCVRGVLVVPVGEMDAATTISIQLQTAPASGGTFIDVFPAVRTILTAGKNAVYAYELDNLQRFVRIKYTVTNTKNAIFGANVVGWHRPTVPVS